MTPNTILEPVGELGRTSSYAVPRHAAPCDLRLDGNEGRGPRPDLVRALGDDWRELLRRYPDASGLERVLAGRLGVAPEQVLVTAGGDDALARLCQATLDEEREAILPVPTFEMIERYAAARRATVRTVPWTAAAWPVEGVLAAVGPATALVFAVTPNNPTGAVVTADELCRISAAAPQAILAVDLAYTEFADVDLTRATLALPNAVTVRTFSKAWGLAGLRVGYAVGPREVIDWLRRAGQPYPVAGPALAIAQAWLERGEGEVEAFAATVQRERERIAGTLSELGARPLESQANFVLARFDDALLVRDALAGLGIAVRAFPGRRYLEDALRITCPGDGDDLWRLRDGLRAALAPEALLVDEGAGGLAGPNAGGRPVATVERADANGVRGALERSGRQVAWMLCSSPTSVRAARAARVVPIGVAPDTVGAAATELLSAGAARIVASSDQLEEVMP